MLKFFVLFATLSSLGLGAPQLGKNDSGVDGRIVGGQDTTIEAHPYIVSFLEDGWHQCGGSIISPTWIVSAAHCIDEDAEEGVEYSIRTGSTFRNSGGEVIPVTRIIIHPLYLRATLDYDIMLLELASPITISVAQVITLAEEGDPPLAGTTATITGWGALWEGGPAPTILQVVQVPIISMANCRAAYGAAITDRMFCAAYLGVGGRDACQGDSGGPLVTDEVLSGVVSWGAGCARPNAPGVYASIPNLRSWIRENSGV